MLRKLHMEIMVWVLFFFEKVMMLVCIFFFNLPLVPTLKVHYIISLEIFFFLIHLCFPLHIKVCGLQGLHSTDGTYALTCGGVLEQDISLLSNFISLQNVGKYF